jgi:outer membrane protein assembly factor BamA
MKKISLLFLLLIPAFLYADEPDTTCKKSFIVVPIAYYQPETSLALGAAGGYYFESNNLRKISSISYSAIYSFKNQFIFHIAPKIYSKSKKYYFYTDIKARYYPDVFYNSINEAAIESYKYISRHVQLAFQPQRFITKSWSVGVNYFMRYESPLFKDSIDSQHQVYQGFTPYFIQGLGLLTTYDTRDNMFYPSKGFFAKLSTWFAPKAFASDFVINTVNLDIRQYVPLGKNHIFAYQLCGVSMSAVAPFQLMPTIGGPDKMRGFIEGMYKANNVVLAQAEYRFPLYKRLKGVAFGGVAQLYDTDWVVPNKLKVSYGAGLRYRLNDARVHLRFDYAFTNYNKGNFYITATEAF